MRSGSSATPGEMSGGSARATSPASISCAGRLQSSVSLPSYDPLAARTRYTQRRDEENRPGSTLNRLFRTDDLDLRFAGAARHRYQTQRPKDMDEKCKR